MSEQIIMMQRITWLGLIGLAATVAACSSTHAPGRAVEDPLERGDYPRIAALGGLEGYLAASEPVIERSRGQPIHVTVPVRLTSGNDGVNAQYRFLFLNSDGTPVGPPMEWRYQWLPPRSRVFLEATASSEEAQQWRLEIRPAK